MDKANPAADVSVGILSSALEQARGEFQIFPPGAFRAKDGRPRNAPAYRLEKDNAAALVSAFNTQKNPIVVDYEHQAILSKDNGKPAPAAGWVHGLEWRDGKGLFATGVKWTAAAREAILADEYRYISPVFTYRPGSGQILELFNVALTNTPALDGMEAAVAHSLHLPTAEPGRELESLTAELHAARASVADLEAAKVSTVNNLDGICPVSDHAT